MFPIFKIGMYLRKRTGPIWILFCFERLVVVENKGMMSVDGLLRVNKQCTSFELPGCYLG